MLLSEFLNACGCLEGCCYLVAKLCLTLFNPTDSQAPLSMGFSRQEYWNGLPFPSPGDCPNPRIEPISPAWVGSFFTSEPPGNSGCLKY